MAERLARNEAAFRDANERINRRATEVGLQLVPFLCECADPGCTEVIRLPLDEYERIRSEPTQFLNAPGHERNSLGLARVVERCAGYLVVAKTGPAAPIAAALDPRGEQP